MKRTPAIVLALIILAPLGMDADAETMAERKQRIMRKYLRERQTLVQSDLVLPEINEDEGLDDSQNILNPRVDITPRRASMAPPVQPYQPIPVQAQQNWLLDQEDGSADPYSDPFAVSSEEDTEETEEDWYTQWRQRRDELEAAQQSETPDTYGFDRDRRAFTDGEPDFDYSFGGNQEEAPSYYGNTPRTSYGQPQTSYGQPRTSYGQPQTSYGQQQSPYGQSQPNSGLYTTPRYGSSPSSGMLAPTMDYDGTSGSAGSSYTPYQSPYQSRQQQPQQDRYAQPQQQEFTRPTPYQKWKDENQGWDPTADDAYLDELMRRNRR